MVKVEPHGYTILKNKYTYNNWHIFYTNSNGILAITITMNFTRSW